MTKPYSRTAFCSCGVQFEATNRRQRSCPACLEARAAAKAAKPPVACRRCGSTQDVTRCLCPTCRAAFDAETTKSVERSEQRRFKKFGACPNHPDRPAIHDGMCYECDAKRVREARRADFQKQMEAKRQAAQPQPAPQDTDTEHLVSDLAFALIMVLLPFARLGDKSEQTPQEEEINPEQLDAPDQAAIDAAFRALMTGIEL